MENERDPLRKIPTKHAPDPKADIGGILRSARESRGTTLEAVCQQTRISRRYLEALESNRFEEFPALAYLRGFLKSYCDYLELDFERLWRFATTDPEPAPAPTPAPAPPPSKPTAPPPPIKAPAPHASPTLAPASTHLEPAGGTRPQADRTPVPQAAAIPGKLGGQAQPQAAAARQAGGQRSSAAEPARPPTRDLSSAAAVFLLVVVSFAFLFWMTRPSKVISENSAPAVPAALAPVHSNAEQRAAIDFRNDVWASINVDGQTRFEGRVPRATRQEWRYTKSISMRFSAPDAVRLSLNGAPLKLPALDATGSYRLETQ